MNGKMKREINYFYNLIELELKEKDYFNNFLNESDLNKIIQKFNPLIKENKLEDYFNEKIIIKAIIFAYFKEYLKENQKNYFENIFQVAFKIKDIESTNENFIYYKNNMVLNFLYLIFKIDNAKQNEYFVKELLYSVGLVNGLYNLEFISKMIFFNIKPFFQFISKGFSYKNDLKKVVGENESINIFSKISGNAGEFYLFLDKEDRDKLSNLVPLNYKLERTYYINSSKFIFLKALIYKFILKKDLIPKRNIFIENEYNNFAMYLLYRLI